MDARIEILEGIYGDGREETRLVRSRHGQLERLTTMTYIQRLCPAPAAVLEIGAGTGAYSLALAKKGYDVTALELVSKNVEILWEKTKEAPNVTAVQGDALDLGRFQEGSFDMTLCLGPLYHLFAQADAERAIDEAVRVTKPGGVLMAAFLSVHAILYNNYLRGEPLTVRAGLEENFDERMRARHFPEQGFTGYAVEEFEALFEGKPVEHLATVSADSVLELAEDRSDFFLSDEDFAAFVAYHLRTCERRELLGSSSHLLYICRKL